MCVCVAGLQRPYSAIPEFTACLLYYTLDFIVLYYEIVKSQHRPPLYFAISRYIPEVIAHSGSCSIPPPSAPQPHPSPPNPTPPSSTSHPLFHAHIWECKWGGAERAWGGGGRAGVLLLLLLLVFYTHTHTHTCTCTRAQRGRWICCRGYCEASRHIVLYI